MLLSTIFALCRAGQHICGVN